MNYGVKCSRSLGESILLFVFSERFLIRQLTKINEIAAKTGRSASLCSKYIKSLTELSIIKKQKISFSGENICFFQKVAFLSTSVKTNTEAVRL